MKTSMADLPSAFWGGWITVITVVSLAGLVWLLFSIYFSSGQKDQQEHVIWDETLNEGKHPAPMWWFWLILAAMVFSVIYLMLYPGLGAYSGALKWSQGHRLEQSYAGYNETYEQLRKTIPATAIATLQEDEFVMNTGRGIFDRNCAVCHGPNGEGQASRFPNLIDADWQWGNSHAQIEQSIRQGRRANMPAWGTTLDEQQIASVIGYIRTFGPGGTTNVAGQQTYTQFCTGCHGADGKGNPMLGASDLSDTVWLYGSDDAALTETIHNGRNGIMPGFEGRLDDVQIRMLIAWLAR